ncbi:MAG: class I SAM-dependent methyltransferase [Spirochaetes bacterium]|nr:class I SAM-dependent methyltransferase [Spirochaetota bacterium]
MEKNMEPDRKNRVCPAEHAGALDLNIRRLFHDPGKMLKPYIREGMTVLDLGCGPGFFTMEMARLAGKSGKVTAADLQEDMLKILRKKIDGAGLADTVRLHKCGSDGTGLSVENDFILVFYMLHEVPDQEAFLREIRTLLKRDGKALIVEPKFHVSKNDFVKVKDMIRRTGFEIIEEPGVFFSRAVVIKSA